MSDQNESNVPATYQKQVAATIEKARKAARDRKKAERHRRKLAQATPESLAKEAAELAEDPGIADDHKRELEAARDRAESDVSSGISLRSRSRRRRACLR